MSANPHANTVVLLQTFKPPNFARRLCGCDVYVAQSSERWKQLAAAWGKFLRDVMKLNLDSQNFRLFSPDESNSNRWQDVLEVTNRAWAAETLPYDDHLAVDGRVMEVLSEHQCQGWLEGYLLTGRHALLLQQRGLHPHH